MNHRSVFAVDSVAVPSHSEVSGPGRRCRAPKADRHGLSRQEAEHNRRTVDTLDSEEKGPTAGGAGSSLSSTAGRLAAPLRGKYSRREDGTSWKARPLGQARG